MPQNLNNIDDDDDDNFMEDLDAGDFVFILNENGDLKSLMLPEDYQDGTAPENVIKVLKLFGASGIQQHTIH